MSHVTMIKNGNIYWPELKAFAKGDVYIRDGIVIAKDHLMENDTLTEWDAKGHYVSPGFIDMHVHVFENYAKIGINADRVGIEQGVTTIVDAGSSGYEDFQTFKKEIIAKNITEVRSFLNISKKGLVAGLSELSQPEYLMGVEEWKEIKEREPAIVGLKARMSQSVVGDQGIRPLEHARMLADQTDVPIMVHIGSPPPPLKEIFPLLQTGDIVTHAFHGKKGGILTEDGTLITEAADALARGVRFDVGHGTSSFSYDTIRRFRKRYVSPFTISTDIYDKNIDKPVGSLMDTISKLLVIGYPLEELLQAVTILPAQTLSLANYGSLKPGNKADITVFELDHHDTELIDSHGESITADTRLIPYATWKSGKLEYKRS